MVFVLLSFFIAFANCEPRYR